MIIIKQEKTLITQTHGKVGRFHTHQKRHFPYPLAFLKSPGVQGLLAKTNEMPFAKKLDLAERRLTSNLGKFPGGRP